LHSNRKQHTWNPLKASELSGKVESEDINVNVGLGLTEFLNAWVKKQHEVECKLTKGLTSEQKAFLVDRKINKKKYGCVLPPSSAVMPEISEFKFTKTNNLGKNGREEILQCLQILKSSRYSWSAQCSSTPNQHHIGIAISTMQLHKDKQPIYQYYLGEDVVRELFFKVLGLIRQLAPSFQPWHGISASEHCQSNPIQVLVQESTHHNAIGPLLGATMAERTAAINQKYQIGLKQVDKAISNMVVCEHDGQRYINKGVHEKLRDLYRVSHYNIHQFYHYCTCVDTMSMAHSSPLPRNVSMNHSSLSKASITLLKQSRTMNWIISSRTVWTSRILLQMSKP
jgi:hypothetical protein